MDTPLRQSFAARMAQTDSGLRRRPIDTLQVNIGLLCNQSCSHCHVDSSPRRTRENMSETTVDRVIALLDHSSSLRTVDITGGAPELNPHFRKLVSASRARNLEVIDRSNLTVLGLASQADTPEFLAGHRVRVIASLPCYSRETVDKQRGDGVFERSIEGLRLLNAVGYGSAQSGLVLDLVYNPAGAFLPPNQEELRAEYTERLMRDHDIRFNRLFTLTNMPIQRFRLELERSGRLGEYMTLLRNAYNPEAAENVMCRGLLSLSWDGAVYDCDFNQALGIAAGGKRTSIWEIASLDEFSHRDIAVGDHCYGCTAGCGSSCTGTVV